MTNDMHRAEMVPYASLPPSQDPTIWLAFFSSQDGRVNLVQKLADMTHEARALLCADLMTGLHRTWAAAAQGQDTVEGLYLVRVFLGTESTYQRQLRESAGIVLQ